MTLKVGRGWARLWFSRSRRKIFSTSMIASSTTSPMAIANPPSVMVFRLMPNLSISTIAVSSDSGMAVSEMNAVRK
jgi:hypothetical protein